MVKKPKQQNQEKKTPKGTTPWNDSERFVRVGHVYSTSMGCCLLQSNDYVAKEQNSNWTAT